MTTYADPTRCPDCGGPITPPTARCPECGIPLTGPVAVSLFRTLQSADQLLGQLRMSRSAATATVIGQPSAPAPSSATTMSPQPGQGLPPLVAPGTVPTGTAPVRTGLAGASVPKILLSLGALCLLVAAVIFLAVTWSRLGVGGRTAVLLAMTVLASGLAWWFDRRGLRVAAESLTVVAFGLLVLDVVGADSAGWFGELTTAHLVVTVGSIVGLVGLATSYLTTRTPPSLLTPQIFALLGLWAVPVGITDLTEHNALVFALATAGFGALAAMAHRRDVGRLPWLAAAAAVTWWLPLTGTGLVRLLDHPSLRGLWAELHAWPFLAAAVLLLIAAWALRRVPVAAAVTAGFAAVMVTLVAVVPALDEATDTAVLTTLATAVAWAVALLLIPAGWRATPTLPMTASLAVPMAFGLEALASISRAALELVGPWAEPASVRLTEPGLSLHPVLLVLTAGAVGLALVALSRWWDTDGPRHFARTAAPFLATFVALAAVAALAAYAVPLAVLLAVLLGLTGALVAAALVSDGARAQGLLASALLPAFAAAALSLANEWLTLVVLVVLLVGAAVVSLRGRHADARMAAGTLIPPLSAGVLWTVGELAGLHEAWRGVPVLLILGAMAFLRPRLTVEIPAAITGAIAAAASVGFGFGHSAAWGQQSLALHLTVAGALVTASALRHPQRRMLGYPGGLLLAMATWVRLNELGITAPEAYTLPSASALVLLGVQRLRRDPHATSLAALAAGLSLATVPSLLRVMVEEPITVRALLLGLACLALVLAGVRLRWSAPLVVGAVVGGLLVLREAGPYAADLPSWVVIALAGSVLTLVGVTWESRLNNLRDAGSYLAHLR